MTVDSMWFETELPISFASLFMPAQCEEISVSVGAVRVSHSAYLDGRENASVL